MTKSELGGVNFERGFRCSLSGYEIGVWQPVPGFSDGQPSEDAAG